MGEGLDSGAMSEVREDLCVLEKDYEELSSRDFRNESSGMYLYPMGHWGHGEEQSSQDFDD